VLISSGFSFISFSCIIFLSSSVRGKAITLNNDLIFEHGGIKFRQILYPTDLVEHFNDLTNELSLCHFHLTSLIHLTISLVHFLTGDLVSEVSGVMLFLDGNVKHLLQDWPLFDLVFLVCLLYTSSEFRTTYVELTNGLNKAIVVAIFLKSPCSMCSTFPQVSSLVVELFHVLQKFLLFLLNFRNELVLELLVCL